MPTDSVERNATRRDGEPSELIELPGVGKRIEMRLVRVAGDSFEELATTPVQDVLDVEGISEDQLFSMKQSLEMLLDIDDAFTDWHAFSQKTDQDVSDVELIDASSETYYCEVGNGILKLPESTSEEPKLLERSADVPVYTSVETDYNPDADTSEWEEFLEEIIATQAERDTMMELVGNALAPHKKYPYIGVLYGTGGNGKSVMQDTIIKMIGDRFSGMSVGELGSESADRHLDGKLLNSAGHIGDPTDVDGELLAELTDPFQGNPQETAVVDDRTANTAQFLFGTNHVPLPPERLLETPERWVQIEFPYQFKPDPVDSNERQSDRSSPSEFVDDTNIHQALLLNAVEGYSRLAENGDVSLPESPQERISEYRDIKDQNRPHRGSHEQKYRHL